MLSRHYQMPAPRGGGRGKARVAEPVDAPCPEGSVALAPQLLRGVYSWRSISHFQVSAGEKEEARVCRGAKTAQ